MEAALLPNSDAAAPGTRWLPGRRAIVAAFAVLGIFSLSAARALGRHTLGAQHPAAFAAETMVGGGGLAPVDAWANASLAHGQSLAVDVRVGSVCEEETGGTCIFWDCYARRNASCKLGLCLCPPGTCRNAQGLCGGNTTTSTPGGKWSPPWLREHVHLLYWGAPLAATLRSAGESALMFVLGAAFKPGKNAPDVKHRFFVDGGDGGPRTLTWEEVRASMRWSAPLACAIAAVKLPLWHLGQPAAFLLCFYAYGPLMGRAQWLLALVVVARELGYVLLIGVATLGRPAFLLFNPFAEEDKGLVPLYIFAPEKFLAAVVKQDIGTDTMVWFVVFSFVADVCALLALVSGLCTATGVMWPALAVGYLMAFMSLVGFIIADFLR